VSGTAACSEQLCSMLGIVAEQAGLGLAQLRAAFAPASWFTVLRALAKAQKGAPTLGMELAHTRPDGATGWLLCNVEPVWSGRGQITAVRGTALNITERMQLDHLRAAKDAAELASEHKTRFLSSMSHELRTPLNAVLGFAQVLTMSSLVQGDVSTKTSVQHVLSAGQHLLAMVDDILDLAGIESGKIDLQPEYVDLAQVITECVDMTTMDALGRGLNVDVRVPERPLMVAGNGRRLRQIVLNLLSNGIKYNKPHGDLMVESRCSGGVVQVSVTDTGKGLSPAQQACLFEPFNRLGAENSTVPGTGIGLVLTQRLAQAMNARIEFSSALGQGSTFTLVIPQVTP
jgi:signal transduction histidine kinase